MCICVLGQNTPHSISQLKQVLGVLAAWTSRADDLVGYLLQRGGAEVVWIVLRANVKQRLVGRRSEWWTGVKGHCDDLITTFFSVVEVALHFLLPARRQLVGDAPNATLRRKSDSSTFVGKKKKKKKSLSDKSHNKISLHLCSFHQSTQLKLLSLNDLSKMPRGRWFQLPKCEYLLVFLVFYDVQTKYIWVLEC